MKKYFHKTTAILIHLLALIFSASSQVENSRGVVSFINSKTFESHYFKFGKSIKIRTGEGRNETFNGKITWISEDSIAIKGRFFNYSAITQVYPPSMGRELYLPGLLMAGSSPVVLAASHFIVYDGAALLLRSDLYNEKNPFFFILPVSMVITGMTLTTIGITKRLRGLKVTDDWYFE